METFHSIKKSSTSLKILQKGQRQKLQTNELKLYFSSLISDISLFLIDNADKVLSDDWLLYYNQRVSPDQAIHYLEDNVINVNLKRLDEHVQKVVITLTSDNEVIPSTELILKTDSNESFFCPLTAIQKVLLLYVKFIVKMENGDFLQQTNLLQKRFLISVCSMVCK